MIAQSAQAPAPVEPPKPQGVELYPAADACPTADATWSGDVVLPDGLTVLASVTLTLSPGCRLLIGRDSSKPGSRKSLRVLGRLIARGTPSQPIRVVFEAPGGTIELHESGQALFRHLELEAPQTTHHAIDVHARARLDWRGGRATGGLASLYLASGRADLRDVALSGGSQGLRLEGGVFHGRGLELRGCAQLAVVVAGRTRAWLESCRILGGGSGACLEGGRLVARRCVFVGQSGPAISASAGNHALDQIELLNGPLGLELRGGLVRARRVRALAVRETLLVAGGRAVISQARFSGGTTGLRLLGGELTLSSSALEGGQSGAYVEGGRLVLRDCVFRGQTATALSLLAGAHSFDGVSLADAAAGLETRGGSASVRRLWSQNVVEAVVVRGGQVFLSQARVTGGMTGVHLKGGRADVRGLRSQGVRGAVRLMGGELELRSSVLEGGQSGAYVEGGRLVLRDCAFQGQSETALSLLAGDHRLDDVDVADGPLGLELRAGLVTARRLRTRGLREAVVVHDGSAVLSNARLEGGAAGLRQHGGEVDLESSVVANGQAGIHVRSGRLRARRCRVDGQTGFAVAVEGDGKARLDGCRLSNAETGLIADGARASATNLEVSDCRWGVNASSGELVVRAGAFARCVNAFCVRGACQATWEDGTARKCVEGLLVEGGRLEARRLSLLDCGAIVRGRGAQLVLSRSRVRADLPAAAVAEAGAWLVLRGCRLEGAEAGAQISGSHAHLDDVDFSLCRQALNRAADAEVCARGCRAAAGANGDRLRRLALATRRLAPLRWLYASIYAGAALLAAARIRAVGGVRTVAVHRGLISGDWEPGISDIDLLVLAVEPDRPWLDRFWRAYSSLKALFPFLGEVLVAQPAEWRAFSRHGGAQVGHALPARLLGEPVDGPLPPAGDDALKALGECAHAYTRLIQWGLPAARLPWPVQSRQVFKAAIDLLRNGSPGGPAERRRDFWESGFSRRGLDGWRELLQPLTRPRPPEDRQLPVGRLAAAALLFLDQRARAWLRSQGLDDAAGAGPCGAVEGPEDALRLASLLGARARGGFGETVDRSYVVVDLPAPDGLAEGFAHWARLRALEPERAACPIPLTSPSWTAWSWLPYLEDPTRALGAASSGRSRLLPGHGWSRWGRLDDALAPEPVWRVAVQQSAAAFLVTWRHLESAHPGCGAAQAYHYLLSRAVGLRLILERRMAVPFCDVDRVWALGERYLPDLRPLAPKPLGPGVPLREAFLSLAPLVEACLPALRRSLEEPQ